MGFPTHLLPDWEGRAILTGHRGSRLTDTWVEGSDEDWFAIWAHPLKYYLGIATVYGGPRNRREEVHHAQCEGLDLLVVDVRDYVNYLRRSSPDYVQWLWANPIGPVGPGGRVLLGNRSHLLTQDLVRAFQERGRYMASVGMPDRALLDLDSATSVAIGESPLPSLGASSLVRGYKLGRRHIDNKLLEVLGAPLKRGKKTKDWYFYDRLCCQTLEEEWIL